MVCMDLVPVHDLEKWYFRIDQVHIEKISIFNVNGQKLFI